MAQSVTEKVQSQWWKAGKITTEILEAGTWWDAEAYHQLYLDKVRPAYMNHRRFIAGVISLLTFFSFSKNRILEAMNVQHSK